MFALVCECVFASAFSLPTRMKGRLSIWRLKWRSPSPSSPSSPHALLLLGAKTSVVVDGFDEIGIGHCDKKRVKLFDETMSRPVSNFSKNSNCQTHVYKNRVLLFHCLALCKKKPWETPAQQTSPSSTSNRVTLDLRETTSSFPVTQVKRHI